MGYGAGRKRLGQARHAFQQDVPAGEEPNQDAVHHVFLADDHFADLVFQLSHQLPFPLVFCRCVLYLGCLHLVHQSCLPTRKLNGSGVLGPRYACPILYILDGGAPKVSVARFFSTFPLFYIDRCCSRNGCPRETAVGKNGKPAAYIIS